MPGGAGLADCGAPWEPCCPLPTSPRSRLSAPRPPELEAFPPGAGATEAPKPWCPAHMPPPPPTALLSLGTLPTSRRPPPPKQWPSQTGTKCVTQVSLNPLVSEKPATCGCKRLRLPGFRGVRWVLMCELVCICLSVCIRCVCVSRCVNVCVCTGMYLLFFYLLPCVCFSECVFIDVCVSVYFCCVLVCLKRCACQCCVCVCQSVHVNVRVSMGVRMCRDALAYYILGFTFLA